MGYGSRTLTGSEEKYHSFKLEFLALKWAICDHFKDYFFYSSHFEVYKDFNPLAFIKTSCKLNATAQRRVNESASYNFSIHFKPGAQNHVADTLNRFPIHKDSCIGEYSELCDAGEIKSILDAAVNQQNNNESWIPTVNVLSTSYNDTQAEILYKGGDATICSFTRDNIRKAQDQEDWIKKIKDVKEFQKNMTASDVAKESFQFKRLWRELPNMELSSDKIIHRKGDETNQVILPSRLKPLVFKELHIDMRDLGYDRTLEVIKERFFWPKMYDDVKCFVTKMCKCIKDKTPNTLPQAPLKTITSSSPMELIGLDFLHLDTCTGDFQYLLVTMDNFTRYTKEAKTAATKLFNDYILRFGTPGKILHDQGREFENKLFTHLSKLCNIKRLHTIPYHPQCNGQVERMNRSITEMLKTLEETEKKSWKDHVQKLVYADSCTKHSTTGYAPYFLLFERKPRLPIDLILEPTNKATQQTHSKFVDDWRNQMSQAYKIASTNSSYRKRKDIARHDSKGPLTAVLEKRWSSID